MCLKYFYVVICLNIIVNVKSQSQYDDYGDDDAQQQIRTGNQYFLYFYLRIYIS
jgi:hypothetical protein